jgi:hypothetical protein
MKTNSMVFTIVMLLLVAIASYYVGVSGRTKHTVVKSDSGVSLQPKQIPQKDIVEIPNQQQSVASKVAENSLKSPVVTKQTEAIEAEYERKKQEIEDCYANEVRKLQQNIDITIRKYNAVNKVNYAKFLERVNNTVSTSSSYGSSHGSSYGYGAMADGYGHMSDRTTTYTDVIGSPSADYKAQSVELTKELDEKMAGYEAEFEKLREQKAKALEQLEKQKKMGFAPKTTPSPDSYGVVTGILFSEESPLAVIDGNIVGKGKSVKGVKVIKIHQDYVEFENANHRWNQKVNEPASANWH